MDLSFPVCYVLKLHRKVFSSVQQVGLQIMSYKWYGLIPKVDHVVIF